MSDAASSAVSQSPVPSSQNALCAESAAGSVIDLTDHIDLGEQMSPGRFGQVYKSMWWDVHVLYANGSDPIPKLAVKVVNLPMSTNTDGNESFTQIKRELETWKRMEHDNVLPIVGIFHPSNKPLAFVSPWMENGNITHFRKRNPSFPVLHLLRDVIDGLQYLHSFNPQIVHGDMKPANILISQSMQACLCDFGFDHSLSNAATAVQAGGTDPYMAPELVGGKVLAPTKESDIYAYGMTCYEILSGKNPALTPESASTATQDEFKKCRPERTNHFTDEIWAIIDQCWAQDPASRPSATSVLGWIEDIIPESQVYIDIRNFHIFSFIVPSFFPLVLPWLWYGFLQVARFLNMMQIFWRSVSSVVHLSWYLVSQFVLVFWHLISQFVLVFLSCILHLARFSWYWISLFIFLSRCISQTVLFVFRTVFFVYRSILDCIRWYIRALTANEM